MSKNILILGAAGQISQMLISNLLENTDFNLKLYGRNLSNRIRVTDVSRENIIDGDFSDQAKLVQAMKDVDVVYLNSMESVADTQTIIAAMNEAGVKRIIGATIVGIYDEFDGPLKEWTNANLSESYRIDERKSAQLVENSNLDYTLVRLTWLINDESHLDYVLLEKGQEVKLAQVSRQVASLAISKMIIDDSEYIGKSLAIGEPGTEYSKPSFY